MTRWVKRPVDLGLSPRLLTLRVEHRWTFSQLFDIADRRPPRIGWLQNERGEALSLREIGRRTGISWPTIRRHVLALCEAQLVGTDTAGRYFLPDVALAEQRCAKTRPSSTRATRQTRPTPGARTVENQLALELATSASGPLSGRDPPEVNHSTHGVLSRSQTIETPYGAVTSSWPVENPEPTALELEPLVPDDVTNPDARYLLSKLAATHAQWRRALSIPRDRRTLVRLHDQHEAEFVSALRDASLTDAIRNPGAWLNASVRSIAQTAGGEEIAS